MTADLLLDFYERIAEAPDAIARLRRFVLNLAVRGKLVPQDAGDEPASALLKRIQRKQAVAERSGRQSRTAGVTVTPEHADETPRGWEVVTLAELVTVLNGRAYKQQELLSAGTPVLRVGNLFTSNNWYYSNLKLDDDKYIDKGDLIYAWSASFGPFIWQGDRVIYHYHIWKLALHSETDLDKLYLYNALLQQTREIKAAGHGISMVHMTKEKMERLAIPLPPLAEQHRIVAKVDELMALCDQLEAARTAREATRDRLAAASLARLNSPDPETFPDDARFALAALPALTTRPDQIKQLRQTILNLAVRGKLVPQIAGDEAAAKLLNRVALTKARLLQSGAIPRNRDAAADPQWMQTELPASWLSITLGQVSNFITSGSRGWAEFYAPTGPCFVRAQNIRFGRLNADDLARVNPPANAEGSRTQVERGDLLVVITGAGVTSPAMVERDLGEAYVSQHIGLVKPTDSELSPWLLLCLMADSGGRAELVQRAYGAGRPGLNLDNLRGLSIPLPPLAEQRRIIAKVNALMALCDQLEASLTAASNARTQLLEATLREALAPAMELAA